MQNSMQHPEILLCFSGPVELLLVQIPFPNYSVSCLPTLMPTAISPWPHLFLVPGLGWLLLSRAQCRVPAQGWWPCLEPSLVSCGPCQGQLEGIREPPVLPVAPRSWALNLHYIDRGFLGGSRGAGAGMDNPSLHPGSATPLHVLAALPHFRAVPPPHPTASHPHRPCPEGPGPAINQLGLPLPLPCATTRTAGLTDFPCPPRTALSPGWIRSLDVLLPRGTRDGAGAERDWLGTVRGTGHRGNQAPLCWHLLGCRAHPGSSLGIPMLVDPPRLPVGLRRCRDPLGRAPGAADFLSSCHDPGFDSFRLLPALPPSSISSASVTALWQLNSMEP